MKFGIFYEHQLPRPWDEGSELQLIQDALDQVELADSLGFDVVWEVEHHFLEEYSHSSAPEVFLAACSQRTKDIRLGHGIPNSVLFARWVLSPEGQALVSGAGYYPMPPAQAAEALAKLDAATSSIAAARPAAGGKP
jgi:hypothetical protein